MCTCVIWLLSLSCMVLDLSAPSSICGITPLAGKSGVADMFGGPLELPTSTLPMNVCMLPLHAYMVSSIPAWSACDLVLLVGESSGFESAVYHQPYSDSLQCHMCLSACPVCLCGFLDSDQTIGCFSGTTGKLTQNQCYLKGYICIYLWVILHLTYALTWTHKLMC